MPHERYRSFVVGGGGLTLARWVGRPLSWSMPPKVSAMGRNRPARDERGRLTAACQAPQSRNNRNAVRLDYFFVAFLTATFFTAFLAGTAFAGEPAIKRLSAVTPFFFNASTNQSGRLPRPDQV